MTMKPEPTLEELKWAIAKAETECPDDGENVGMNHGGIHTEFGYRRFQDHPHVLCNGTGRVPRFPELRAKQNAHRNCAVLARILSKPGYCDVLYAESQYGDCHGLGFVPLWSKPEDLATWIRVLATALDEASPFHDSTPEKDDFWDGVVYGDILGAFQAVVKTLGIEVRQEART